MSADLPIQRKFAELQADRCKHLCSTGNLTTALELFERFQLGELPYTTEQLEHRLADSNFWLRRIRHKTLKVILQIERALTTVSRHKAIYCGDTSYQQYLHNKQKSTDYLERTYLENEQGEKISLAEISEHNISNPAIRRAELMVRIRGFEEVSAHCQHAALFTTITTPSRMHAALNSGGANPAYDGSSVNNAQSYLNHVWQLIRSKLDKCGIRPYGFRVVEPHHDGTPHWHLLLFMPPEQISQFKKITTHYALQDSPNEKGASKYRINFVDIDPNKGSAAGYIAKYVAKNIDGFAIETDKHGTQAALAAQRTCAWAKANKIRQFQQIGGPSVTVWRELRRLAGCQTTLRELDQSYVAADHSNWAAFCIAMNAVNTKRKEHALAPSYSVPQREIVDFTTGELTTTNTNSYGEVSQPSITGVFYRKYGVDIKTRTKKWRIQTGPPWPSASSPAGGEVLGRGGNLGLV